MSKTMKKSSQAELKEDIDDVLSTGISRSLQIDDFVWIENTSKSSEVILFDDPASSSETSPEIVNIAQHDTNTESSGSVVECLPESNGEDTETGAVIPLEWEKEILVDQQYWDQYGSVAHKEKSARIKYPVSQRLTVSQSNYIENGKTINRDPSYYKLSISTTATLKTLLEEKYVGPLHNVVHKGKSTVVIHASCPLDVRVVRVSFYAGNAVKVYKLTNDVKKNVAILKRAQREYEHLYLLRNFGAGPIVVYRMKNVLILGFFGDYQDTPLSISSLPSEHYKELYERIVHNLYTWYTKFNIVHGKLCTNNILFRPLYDYEHYNDKTVVMCIVGWGHSVKGDHPRALMKLIRDCHFVTNFFIRGDFPVKSTEELFKYITGLDKISSKVLDAIYKKDLWLDGHLTNPNR